MHARRFITLFGKKPLAQKVAALFANGEAGVWYDPSDFSTMFQDSAGATPVTATGQPVGKMLDKSGRGNHATQPTSASRPVLQQDGSGRYYLDFDGVDDSLDTASINFTATDKMTVWAGVRKTTDAAAGHVMTIGDDYGGVGTGELALLATYTAGVANWRAFSKGTALSSATTSGAATAPTLAVATALADIAGDSIAVRLNGVQRALGTADQGTGTFGNKVVYVGIYGGTTQPFIGSIYSLIVRGAASDAAQITSGEAYVNSKTGAY